MSDAGISQAAIEKLTDADAFRSLELDRRQALWEVAALGDKPTGVFIGQPSESTKEHQMALPFMTQAEHVVQDYAATGLSLKAHPVSFVREKLDLLRVTPTRELVNRKDGDLIKVAGLVTVRQRPGTAKGILFITIEDETGFANLVVWENMFDKYRKEILQARLLMVEGKLQIEGKVIHVITSRCFNLSALLRGLTTPENDDQPVLTLSRADQRTSTPDPREIFHKGRNFK